jgi:hypothetical protein
MRQPPCIRTQWRSCRAPSSALLLRPAQANVAEVRRRTLATDDERARASTLLLRSETGGLPRLARRAARYRVGRICVVAVAAVEGEQDPAATPEASITSAPPRPFMVSLGADTTTSAKVTGEGWLATHARTVEGKTVLTIDGKKRTLPRADLARLARA